MRLNNYIKLTGKIRLKTGLHVGSGEKEEKSAPASVMISPITRLPYIPGSSVKGKMRCLLELVYGKTSNGNPCMCGDCQICILFGSLNSKAENGPTRLLFRDCKPTENTASLLEEIDLENKPGIRIDRRTGRVASIRGKTGKGEAGLLFNIQRVPEGCEFDFEVSVRIFDKDNKEAIKKWLAMGMYLMEQDALGGGGSRGSGQIEFRDIKFDGEEFPENWREVCKEDKDNLLNVKVIE